MVEINIGKGIEFRNEQPKNYKLLRVIWKKRRLLKSDELQKHLRYYQVIQIRRIDWYVRNPCLSRVR